MPIDPLLLARTASWLATGLGLGLWLWSWLRVANPIQKLRFLDCGVVLVFASILLRFAVQERTLTGIEWGLAVVSPLFIAAALWRLARTGHPTDLGR
ncbi:hypothetical protein BH10PSE2_BH10PSE2_19530 [soil metagenome]